MFKFIQLLLSFSLFVSIQASAASMTGSYIEELSERLKIVLLFDDPVNPDVIKKGSEGATIRLPAVDSLKLNGLRKAPEKWFKISSERATPDKSEFELVFGEAYEITAFPSAQYNRELGTMFVVYLKPVEPLTKIVEIDPIRRPNPADLLSDTQATELSSTGKSILDERYPLPASRKEARELLVQRIDEGVRLVASSSRIDPRAVRSHLKNLKDVLQKFVQNAPLTVKDRVTLGTPITERLQSDIDNAIASLATDLEVVDDRLALQIVVPDESVQIFQVAEVPDLQEAGTASVSETAQADPSEEISVDQESLELVAVEQQESPLKTANSSQPTSSESVEQDVVEDIRMVQVFDPVAEQMALYTALLDELLK